MRRFIMTLLLGAALASPAAFAGAYQYQPDAIFQVTRASAQPVAACYQRTRDSRNPIVRGLTSLSGQTIIGGLIGAVIGNQFGGGDGKKIATGVGAAIGASMGARHARSTQQTRNRVCQSQYRNRAGGYASAGYRYR